MKELNWSSSIPEVELWTNDTCSSSNHPNTILAVITIVSAILTIPNIVGNMVNKLVLLYGIVVLVLRDFRLSFKERHIPDSQRY